MSSLLDIQSQAFHADMHNEGPFSTHHHAQSAIPVLVLEVCRPLDRRSGVWKWLLGVASKKRRMQLGPPFPLHVVM